MKRLLHYFTILICILPCIVSFRSQSFIHLKLQKGLPKQASIHYRVAKPSNGLKLQPIESKSPFQLNSLIQPNDYWSIWSAVALSSFIGLKLEQKTAIGRSLSSPECATLASSVLQTLNIMPSSGSVYIPLLQTFIVKYAAPLVLLGADVREIYPETSSLIGAFVLGTLGTLVGSFTAFLLLHKWFQAVGLLDVSWKFIGAVAAKNIGGGLNFQAVTRVLNTPADYANLSMAIDNLIGLIYFPVVYYIAKRFTKNQFFYQKRNNSFLPLMKKTFQKFTRTNPINSSTTNEDTTGSNSESIILTPEFPSDSQIDIVDVPSLLSAVALAFLIVSTSEMVSLKFKIHPILISNCLTIFLASTVFSSHHNKSRTIRHIVTSGNVLGRVLYLLLYGSWGYFIGNIFQLFSSKFIVPLFLFSFLLYSIHLLFVFIIGKYLFHFDTSDLLLGSNANIGNAATASGLARTMKWNRKIIPSILIGNIGSLIGTRVGLLLANEILKPFITKSS